MGFDVNTEQLMVMQLLLFQAKDAVKELNTAYRKQIELVREENSLKLQVNNYTSKTVKSKYTFFLQFQV